jgi:type II secretory pathway component PulF
LAGTLNRRSLADVVTSGGARFDACERSLMVLGEESGRLDHSLRLLGEYFTRRHKLMRWVKKQMAYPVTTGLASGVIGPMPLLIKGFTWAYVGSAVGALLLLGAAAGGVLLGVANGYAGRPHLARARLARALATAIEAGLPLGRSLRLAADVSGNHEMATHINRWSERELSTQSIAVTLAGCPHLTAEFRAGIETAERTGDFSIITRLAQLYEDGFK